MQAVMQASVEVFEQDRVQHKRQMAVHCQFGTTDLTVN